MRPILYWLKRFFWHRNQGYAEITEPLNGLSTLLNLFSFLILRYDVKFSSIFYVGFIIGANVLLGMAGFILKRIGVISLGQQLSNEQNPELLELMKDIREIKRNVKRPATIIPEEIPSIFT